MQSSKPKQSLVKRYHLGIFQYFPKTEKKILKQNIPQAIADNITAIFLDLPGKKPLIIPIRNEIPNVEKKIKAKPTGMPTTYVINIFILL